MLVLIILIFAVLAQAQNNIIKSIDIRIEKNQLLVTPHFNDFFDENIQSVIASGLSKSFHFYCQLNKFKGKSITEIDETIKIRNDVWEKKYLINYAKNLKHFFEYQHFKTFLLDSLQFNLSSIDILPKNDNLQIFITFSSKNISTSQKNKLQYWLTNENKSKNENQGSSFSINISKLISFFFTEKDKKDIHVYNSKVFTIQSVIKNAQIPQ